MEGGGSDDWDLAAVVRSCSSYCRPKPPAEVCSVSVSKREEEELVACNKSFRFEGPLEELFAAYVSDRKADVCSVSVDPVPVPKKTQRPASQPPRSKRRKKQVKKVVCQVPADGMSSDMWAWRKYGQKPIKGSPYPRGYYRCSSFRGCPARKQVERNRSDPGQLVITYTSDHNHPMPARHKFTASDSAAVAPPASTAEEATAGKQSINDHPASSPTTSSASEEEDLEEGAMLMVEDMEMVGEDELVFMGLDDAAITAPDPNCASSSSSSSCFLLDEDGGGFDDRIFASPWLDNGGNTGGATAAAC